MTDSAEVPARRLTWLERATQPVDGASLAVFRFLFGAIMAWEIVRFFGGGWIEDYFAEAPFRFTYQGFGWVKPLPGDWPWVEAGVLGMAALLMATGWLYRWAALVWFLGFTHFFLIEKARYLNHFYLIVLLSALLVVIPAASTWSIDAQDRGGSRRVPAWCVWLLRWQVGLVYLYAAFAKLNPDWLRCEPIGTWLVERAPGHFLEPAMTQPWSPWLFAYGGLAIDLFAWPLLAWRRTRLLMYLATALFHLLNSTLFGIGVFPWTMLAVTTIFFAPDWPLRFLPRRWRSSAQSDPPQPGSLRRRWIATVIALYMAFQLLTPLRHYLYPGRVSWTEEGHNFAWHMKLRDKDSTATFRVIKPSGEEILVNPRVELTRRQVSKMSGRPDMLLEYAHHLARRHGEGSELAEVYATVFSSLNGRKRERLIDPGVNLAQERRGNHVYEWILPLTEPLHSDRPESEVTPESR